MLHACLVIHNHEGIIRIQLCKLILQKSIDEAVAAFSLCSSHHKQVKIIFLSQSACKFKFRIICLAHTCRNRVFGCHLCTGNLLPDISKGSFYFYTEYLIQVRVCVRINRKNRTFS